MVLVWTHPVCQCPSAALRRSRTPDRWRLRKHWRRSSPFPVLVVVSCAGPAWAGARSPPGYLRSGGRGARIGRASPTRDPAGGRGPPGGGGKRVGAVGWYADCCDEKPSAEPPSQSSTAVALQQVFVSPPRPWPTALRA